MSLTNSVKLVFGKAFPAISIAYFLSLSSVSQALEWIAEPEVVRFENTSVVFHDRWLVTFELDDYRDVEVAIVDTSTSNVVRHLAAGMLGESPPPPLMADSLQQYLVWDGRDDYGQWVANSYDLALRIRVGTDVRMDKIVGGDPYGWFSTLNKADAHTAWGFFQAIDAKDDGNVYLHGNSGALGSPMIRQYDAEGNYIKTVFPFAAGLDSSEVEGWGIRWKPDGTYAPAFSSLRFAPTITDSYVVNPYFAFIGSLLANPSSVDTLTVMAGNWWKVDKLHTQTFNTDGTISLNSKTGKVIQSPNLPADQIEGNIFTAYSNDGNYLYISSLYHATEFSSDEQFYREGRVFKVNLATGEAVVFFDQGAMDGSSGGVSRALGFSQLHGVAVDADDNVYVCDRRNDQIVVLSSEGEVLRTLSVQRPDNIAVSDAGVIYVTTRDSNLVSGKVLLHKFENGWAGELQSESVEVARKIDTLPGADLTDVQVAENRGDPRIWVSYPSAPVKIFSDGPGGLSLEKDFSLLNSQGNLAINILTVDSKTNTLYVDDAFGTVFKVDDWDNPAFEPLMVSENTSLFAGSIAIDERNRYLYTRSRQSGAHHGPIRRWSLDSDSFYEPSVTESGSNVITDGHVYGWYHRTGMADKGFDVGPDGSLAVSGGIGESVYLSYLKYYNRNEETSPWDSITFSDAVFAGARVDLQGNIYAAHYDGPPTVIPEGYEADPFYITDQWSPFISRIYKFSPTRSNKEGSLYPFAPLYPSKIYDVAYGMTTKEQPSSFGVDGYGRLLYPTPIAQKVTLIDNEGNVILSFGTYGNPDSKGGLPGELVPTEGIPLAYAHTVDISDDYVYIGDLNNNRVLRLSLSHDLEEQVAISVRPDSDHDGVTDSLDNCPYIPNPGQEATNGTGKGDACYTLPNGC